MNYLLPTLLAVACCNLAIAIVYVWRRPWRHVNPQTPEFCAASYNMGLRDAGEILRDIRVELGVQVGECYVIEEALHRIRLTFK